MPERGEKLLRGASHVVHPVLAVARMAASASRQCGIEAWWRSVTRTQDLQVGPHRVPSLAGEPGAWGLSVSIVLHGEECGTRWRRRPRHPSPCCRPRQSSARLVGLGAGKQQHSSTRIPRALLLRPTMSPWPSLTFRKRSRADNNGPSGTCWSHLAALRTARACGLHLVQSARHKIDQLESHRLAPPARSSLLDAASRPPAGHCGGRVPPRRVRAAECRILTVEEIGTHRRQPALPR
jgi:hypothetical protein